MERIKAAIQKAKETQKQSGKKSDHNGDPKSRKAVELDPQKNGLESLVYDKTKVIKLDQKHLEDNRIIAHNKNNLLSSSFDLLRTQVLRLMQENGWKTLAITSPNPEAGKTVVSIDLAMSIAQHTEKSAMLVDFDFRRPKVARYLGLELETSINDYIERDVPVENILINPGLPRLVMLASNKPIKNSAEVLASRKIENLINDVKTRYEERVVIFDLPPILNSDDAITILPKIDCVIMIVANGMSAQHEIEDSLRYLHETNLLGVVMNKSEENLKTYY